MGKPKAMKSDQSFDVRSVVSYLRYALEDVRAFSVRSSRRLQQAIDELLEDTIKPATAASRRKAKRSRR